MRRRCVRIGRKHGRQGRGKRMSAEEWTVESRKARCEFRYRHYDAVKSGVNDECGGVNDRE